MSWRYGYTDRATYDLLSSGHTTGVFQLESGGMQRLLRRLKPRTLEDIAAVNALYRPGPMGANAHTLFAKRQFVSLHPDLDCDLEAILGPTYGLIVFQEQVLQVLNVVCGWTYSEAELLFNAMRKKDHGKMEAARPSFELAGKATGYSEEALRTLWDTLVPFADYSFNKSHATGYAVLSYQTAYLKTHYPKEYMCSLLSSVDSLPLEQYGKPSKKQMYIDEVSRMGIDILPPDVNESGVGWTVSEGGIRYGLGAIKGLGKAALNAVVSKRPYRDLDDFLMRVPKAGLNSGVVEALCRSGGLDSLSPSREAVARSLPELLEKAERRRSAKRSGQRGFSRQPITVAGQGTQGRDVELRRLWEKELLGVSISASKYTLYLPQMTATQMSWLKTVLDGRPGGDIATLVVGGQGTRLSAKVDLDALKPVLKSSGILIEEG